MTADALGLKRLDAIDIAFGTTGYKLQLAARARRVSCVLLYLPNYYKTECFINGHTCTCSLPVFINLNRNGHFVGESPNLTLVKMYTYILRSDNTYNYNVNFSVEVDKYVSPIHCVTVRLKMFYSSNVKQQSPFYYL